MGIFGSIGKALGGAFGGGGIGGLLDPFGLFGGGQQQQGGGGGFAGPTQDPGESFSMDEMMTKMQEMITANQPDYEKMYADWDARAEEQTANTLAEFETRQRSQNYENMRTDREAAEASAMSDVDREIARAMDDAAVRGTVYNAPTTEAREQQYAERFSSYWTGGQEERLGGYTEEFGEIESRFQRVQEGGDGFAGIIPADIEAPEARAAFKGKAQQASSLLTAEIGEEKLRARELGLLG